MNILTTQGLCKHYGGVKAVQKVNLFIENGNIAGLIGPNGAGKTTLFNLITGLDNPTSGQIFFEKQEITNLKTYKVTRLGLARTFQNIRLFKEMTVLENIMIGLHFKVYHHNLSSYRFFNAVLSLIHQNKEEIEIYNKSKKWLDFFDLTTYQNDLAKNLPYGKQKHLEIARALATDPKILFLDEPAAGMNPSETEELMSTIKKIKALGITIVIIEHDMRLVMNICDTITVLNYGEKIAEGTPAEIKNNPLVIEAYLGIKQ